MAVKYMLTVNPDILVALCVLRPPKAQIFRTVLRAKTREDKRSVRGDESSGFGPRSNQMSVTQKKACIFPSV